jgi:hypothetical protein
MNVPTLSTYQFNSARFLMGSGTDFKKERRAYPAWAVIICAGSYQPIAYNYWVLKNEAD